MDEETTPKEIEVEFEGEVEVEVEVTEPIIIDLGKQKSKRIKNLMKGKGKLWKDVDDVIDEVAEMLDEDLDGKVIVPLVLFYEKKNKKKTKKNTIRKMFKK